MGTKLIFPSCTCPASPEASQDAVESTETPLKPGSSQTRTSRVPRLEQAVTCSDLLRLGHRPARTHQTHATLTENISTIHRARGRTAARVIGSCESEPLCYAFTLKYGPDTMSGHRRHQHDPDGRRKGVTSRGFAADAAERRATPEFTAAEPPPSSNDELRSS